MTSLIRRYRFNLRLAVGAVAAAGLLTWVATYSGCATAPGVLFDPATSIIEWPPAPDQPRIRYVGQIRGESDLNPGKSGIDNLGEAIFGKTPKQSLVSPLAVCTDGGQRVFIADSNAQAIHVFDVGTRAYKRWAPGSDEPRFVQPVALAFDHGNAAAGTPARLLVSDSAAAEIVVLDSSGKRTGTLGTGLLQRPCGLAIDPASGRIFVTDVAAHQVVILSPDGRELARLGRRGAEPGEFNYPTNVALAGDGTLYVSDSLNFRVQVFSPTLSFVRQIGRKGDMPGYFSQPKGLAVDPDGHLYVVDANFEAVQIFDREGQLLMAWGKEGQAPGEFWLPAGMHIDPTGRIWIADSYNRRVQIFDYLPERSTP